MLVEHSCQRALLDCSVAGLSVKRKYFRQRHSCIFLNLSIQFDKGNCHVICKLGAQRRLASAAQSNQRDALAARLFRGIEVPRQPGHYLFQAMIWKAFEESLNRLFFSRLLNLRGKQLKESSAESRR